MSEPFIAEIRMFAGNFAPRNWAFCNGQILAIAQNTALFSLVGTIYGGNGQTTYALPNLQDRFPMHAGQGPGLTPRSLGEAGGAASVTLTQSEMPAHGHTPVGTSASATTAVPSASVLPAVTQVPVYGAPADLVPLSSSSIAPAGGAQPHENRQPYLALNFIIALAGVYPSRN